MFQALNKNKTRLLSQLLFSNILDILTNEARQEIYQIFKYWKGKNKKSLSENESSVDNLRKIYRENSCTVYTINIHKSKHPI